MTTNRSSMAETEAVKAPVRIHYMIIALGLGYMCSMLNRQSFTILSVYMTEDLQMSSINLGVLGAVMLYSYAIMQVPGGMLADRFGARKTISLALLLAAGSSFLLAMARSFGQAVAARAMAGVATAAIYVPALTAVRAFCDEDSFPFLTSLIFAFGSTGGLLSRKPLGVVTDILGWRNAYLIIGLMTFVAAIGVWLTVPEKRKRDGGAEAQMLEAPADRGNLLDLKSAIFSIQFLTLALWLFTFTGTGNSFEGLWITTYLMEVQSLTRQQVATLLTLVMVLAMGIGPIAGAISKRRSDLVFVFTASLHAVLFGVFACLPANLGYGKSTLYFLARGFTHGALPVVFSQVRKLVPSNLTGTLLGVGNTVGFLGGAVFTQAMGVVMEKAIVTGVHQAFNKVFILYLVLSAVPTLLVWLTNFRQAKEAPSKSKRASGVSA